MHVYLTNKAGVSVETWCEEFRVLGPETVEIDGNRYSDIEAYRLDDERWVDMKDLKSCSS